MSFVWAIESGGLGLKASEMDFVTPVVAIVDIDNEVRGVKAMPAGIAVPGDGVLKTQLMEVFVKREGRWWVEAYHNVDLKPPAKP
jgi:hypothetical protein